MHVDINKTVETFKEGGTLKTNGQIASLLFPDKEEKNAGQALSRLMNGERQKLMTTDFVIQLCKEFNISPNDFFNYE